MFDQYRKSSTTESEVRVLVPPFPFTKETSCVG